MSAPRFAPGDVLAERFRIVRFIALGGMGEVYEAEDLTLRERVALKTVRADLLGQEGAVDALIREVQVARKLAHPSVCQTFDLYHHDRGGADPVRFVAMQLLAGETLAERIQRGPLGAAEALPLVVQIADALHAAHEAGVVHQDLKPDNVVLVPTGGSLRAVVSDFGLARAKAHHEPGLEASGARMVSGTPAYMAPEQIEGREVTVASDVYSLGLVMYEMVTGRQPFPGRSVQDAIRRLRDPVPSPRLQAPALDATWDAVILRALERDPLDRFASAADLARALRGEEVAPSRRELVVRHARNVRLRRWKRAGVALAVLTALGLAQLAFLRWSRQAHGPSRRSVAVLGFKNATGRPAEAWVSTALAELLRAELGAGEKLRTIPGENIARMKAELDLGEVDNLARETLTRVGRNLGSDLVVLGSYSADGGDGSAKLRLDLLLQDTADGTMVAAVADEGTLDGLPDLVSRAGARLRETLGVGEVSAAETGGVRAAVPRHPEAARLYAEGLARLRAFDALAARDALEQAVALEPDAALAHSALAASWSALGFDAKAKAEARKAFDLSAGLSREDRLAVEARYREATRDWPKAIETYRTLWGFFSDNLEYGLRLAEAQTSGGKAKDALITVEAMRKLPAPASEDPRIDLAEALASWRLSDYKTGQARAARAVAKSRALGARLLLAQARFQEGRSLLSLSDYPGALEAAQEAKKRFAEVGDRSGVARSTNLVAIVVGNRGDSDQALAIYEEALTIAREIGDREVMQRVFNNIAIGLRVQGDLSGARNMYEQSLAVSREIDNKSAVMLTLGNVAVVFLLQGDLSGATRVAEESLAIAREIGERGGEESALDKLAAVARLRADLGQSEKLYADALSITRETGDKRYTAFYLGAMSGIAALRGDLVTARAREGKALALRTELGEKGTIASSRAAIALLDIEEGSPERAEAPAREALEEFRREKDVGSEASTLALLARSLLEQGKAPEAEEAIGQARALPGKSLGLETRLTVAVVAARVRVANGQPGPALESLRPALLEATKAGFVASALEIRLALGEIEVQVGSSHAGRARLVELAKDAEARGFKLIASKARKAAGA